MSDPWLLSESDCCHQRRPLKCIQHFKKAGGTWYGTLVMQFDDTLPNAILPCLSQVGQCMAVGILTCSRTAKPRSDSDWISVAVVWQRSYIGARRLPIWWMDCVLRVDPFSNTEFCDVRVFEKHRVYYLMLEECCCQP